jgi:2,3-bisphosphoglycerate-independent phosphoglycerate mutase
VKYLILLGDGMADHPLDELSGRTPLEAAMTPNLDRIAEKGVSGLFCPIPEGLPAGSDVGNLSLFGYNPAGAFRGRAPIEAANQGIDLADDDVAFRCNLVTLEEGRMRDFTAGHISSEEAAEMIPHLNKTLGREFPVTFHAGVSYRHLAVFKTAAAEMLRNLVALECTPPHDITGREWADHLPEGGDSGLVRDMMARSRDALADHPVNLKRIAEGQLPATSIWLWGQGKAPEMESYADLYGLSGAVVSAVDLVKGIGKLAGLEVPNVPGATGWIDTDYEGKISAALSALDRHDFAYIHIEAPDETAHQGRIDLKIRAIEDFDRRIVGPALEYQETWPDTRILAAPDHFTLISTRTHAGGPVPFALCGPGIDPDTSIAYSEKAAAATGVCIREGYTLTQRMLREPSIAGLRA